MLSAFMYVNHINPHNHHEEGLNLQDLRRKTELNGEEFTHYIGLFKTSKKIGTKRFL